MRAAIPFDAFVDRTVGVRTWPKAESNGWYHVNQVGSYKQFKHTIEQVMEYIAYLHRQNAR